MPHNLAIVFDWDEVVFNTPEFKASLAAALAKRGISRKVVLETVGIAKDARGYNPAVHAQMIAKRAGRGHSASGSASAMQRDIWYACRLLAKKLLFPDAVRTIRAAHRAKVPLYVLSAGRRRFQQAKIDGSGLKPLFKEIRIVDVTDLDAAAETKIKVLESFARRHGRLLFLDDRPKNIAAVRAAPNLQGKVLPVLVWRQKRKPPRGMQTMRRLAWPEIKSFSKKLLDSEFSAR